MFANLGSGSLTNVERDFFNRVSQLYGVRLDPFWIPISLDGDDGSVIHTSLPTLAPYEVFAEVFKQGAEQRSLLGKYTPETLESYWTTLARGFRHHLMDVPGHPMNRTVPVFVHSDGGDIYKYNEFSIVSWASAVCEEINTYDTRFLVCVLREDDKIKAMGC